MVATLILTLSVLALLQFAISQWRLIWLTTANQPVSEHLRAATGLDGARIGANDFPALLGFCDELSPGIRKGTPWFREVTCYYCVMTKVQQLFGALPALSGWASAERKICARFVAVVLDQNLAIDLDRRAAARSI